MAPSKPVTYRKITGTLFQLLRPNIAEDASTSALKHYGLQTAVVNVQLLEYHASNNIKPAPKLTDTHSESSHFDHISFILPVLLLTDGETIKRKEMHNLLGHNSLAISIFVASEASTLFFQDDRL